MIIRPVNEGDLDDIVALAHEASFGLTTLPRDRELLAERIADAQSGMSKIAQKPRGERYLFVMEDTESGRVVGTSGIVSKVGGFEPFYAYKIETKVTESKTLSVRKELQTLHLVSEHNGPCEIGSLFLSPSCRRGGLGRLLSLSRFLFIADHSNLFDPIVIAELRGVIDEDGQSPFWEALGRHFFDVDLPTADYQSVVNKQFITDLMPIHPIYIHLLPRNAQAVIGKVHPNTEPALKFLNEQGFTFNGMVDIFEAGPVVSCERDKISTVANSRLARVCDITDNIDGTDSIVCNAQRDFRACKGKVVIGGEGVVVQSVTAQALALGEGDRLRYLPIR